MSDELVLTDDGRIDFNQLVEVVGVRPPRTPMFSRHTISPNELS